MLISPTISKSVEASITPKSYSQKSRILVIKQLFRILKKQQQYYVNNTMLISPTISKSVEASIIPKSYSQRSGIQVMKQLPRILKQN